jgi:dipeptidyl aminopeptidase/acylaminoacyl peptidase
VCLLALLTLSLQSCMGLGDNNTNNNFQSKSTGTNGNSIGISNQAVFKGKIYFTLNRNLYMLDGTRTLTQLTKGFDARDPAVSPDGKTLAFIVRYKNYSDLAIMPTAAGPDGKRKITVLRSGIGAYYPNPNSGIGAPYSTFVWYAQPAWQDNTHLAFLSDLGKSYIVPGVDAFQLDPQIFSISLNNPRIKRPQEVAYATYGDGGNRDPSYRPGHPNQIVYTNYQYQPPGNTQQLIQIYLEDVTAVANAPIGKYRSGVSGREFDPAVALTPAQADLANMNPAFSPDGNSIAYVRRQDATHMGMYVMPVAEGVTENPNAPTTQKKALDPYNKSSQIVSGEYVSAPVWSPDGTQIAYVGYSNSVFNIWLANVTKDAKTGAYKMKGSPIQLTDAGGQLNADSRAFWAP